MRWLRRLVALILALALTATAIVLVLSETTWSKSYLETTATTTHLSDHLATALPDVTSQYIPAGPARTVLTSAITPSYVDAQLHDLIPQFVDAFRGNGPVPLLNLTDLGQAASTLDISLPDNVTTVLDTPQPLVPDSLASPLKTAGRATGQLEWLAPVVAIIAAGLIILIAGRRRWLSLAGAALTAALLTAVAALVVQLPPRLIGAALDSSAARPLVPAIRGFAQVIATDQTHRLLVWALGLMVVALVLISMHGLMSIVMHHHTRHPKPEIEAPTIS